ncbi:tail fiber assembly protein [Klebsiella aerogenes]|uniref:tail fiber assembly protein n=1 Tax=Klebsiella aerogenes TaxID=548 RepID=UPI002FF8C494
MSLAYFSPSSLVFIPAEWKEDGTYTSKNWPSDAVIATEDEILSFWKTTAPEGKTLGCVDGRPAWVDFPLPTKEESVRAAGIKKEQLIADTMQSVSFIQLKIQAGRTLTDSENKKLNSAIDYIDALSSVDTNNAPDIDWPVIAE